MLAPGHLAIVIALGLACQSQFDDYFQFKPWAENAAVVEVRCDRPVGRALSPLLFGKFTEHLGRNIYLGMWSQLLVNPGFEPAKFWGRQAGQVNRWLSRYFETPELVHDADLGMPPGWMLAGEKGSRCSLTTKAYSGETSLQLDIAAEMEAPAGVWHPVYLPVHRVLEYDWSLAVKGARPYKMLVRLRSKEGQVLASESRKGSNEDWNELHGTLRLPPHVRARGQVFYFEILVAGSGRYWLDHALLFPADAADGWDPDVLKLVRESHLPLLRWPGGNFASGYHWRDGVGTVRFRPMRLNKPWSMPEPNHVGTDEFMRFCELAGCEPMICVNAGSGTAQEAADWVQYCNGSANTRFGKMRAKHGHREPYGVRYWEIGNELYGSWQIGHCDASEYARRYRQFVGLMGKQDPKIHFIANGYNPNWNAVLIEKCHDILTTVSLHTLIGGGIPPTADPQEVWRLVVGYPWGYRDYLTQLSDQLRAKVPGGTIAITELQIFTNRPNLPNNSTIAEALFWAGVVHTAARLGDRVELITHSALVNHGGGLRKLREFVYATPVYYARKMYSSQPCKWPVLVRVAGPALTERRLHNLPAVRSAPLIDALALLNDSAKELALLIINRSAAERVPVQLQLRGFKPGKEATWTCLTGDSILAANTYEDQIAVVPRSRSIAIKGPEFQISLPPRSVSVILLHKAYSSTAL